MTEKTSEWGQANFNGPNQRVIQLAGQVSKLYTEILKHKIAGLKQYVRVEGQRVNHPEFDKVVDAINKIELKNVDT